VVRFISLFAILAGVVILASSVAGTRFRRVREVAILKTLGATRRKVITIFSVEFLVLGTAAGLLGTLLANGFTSIIVGTGDGRALPLGSAGEPGGTGRGGADRQRGRLADKLADSQPEAAGGFARRVGRLNVRS
jgi:hypothetical protein